MDTAFEIDVDDGKIQDAQRLQDSTVRGTERGWGMDLGAHREVQGFVGSGSVRSWRE